MCAYMHKSAQKREYRSRKRFVRAKSNDRQLYNHRSWGDAFAWCGITFLTRVLNKRAKPFPFFYILRMFSSTRTEGAPPFPSLTLKTSFCLGSFHSFLEGGGRSSSNKQLKAKPYWGVLSPYWNWKSGLCYSSNKQKSSYGKFNLISEALWIYFVEPAVF